jgi:hypothetical protein
MGVLVMGAMAMDPDKEVDYDPTSVTFGQVRDTKNGWSYNIFGRFTPYVRYLAMMTMRGKMIDGKPVKFDAKKETYKFFRGKAAPFTGVGAYDTTSVATVAATGTVTTADLRKLRKDLGVWGLEPSDLRFIVSTETYFDLMEDTVFQTMDKVGPVATVLTGQVGQVGGTPVLVSDAFPARVTGTASTNTNMGAICVAPANFLAGNQRGLRFDTQDLVETQRKVLVASLRTGLVQFSTTSGMGVSTLRHT